MQPKGEILEPSFSAQRSASDDLYFQKSGSSLRECYIQICTVRQALQVLILEQQASATLIEEGLLAMLMEKGFGGLSDSEWEKMENWNARQDSMEEARYQKIRQITNVELNKALRAPDQTGDREVAQLFSGGITAQEMVQNSRVSDDMENLFKAMKAVLAKGAQSPYKESFSDCPAWNF